MAWRYPVYGLEQEYVVDIDPINENFLSLTEEASGYLNEHNLSSLKKLLVRGNFTRDAAYIIHRSLPTEIPNVDRAFIIPSNWLVIGPFDTWQTWPNTLGAACSFTAVGGMCWICASFNVEATSNAAQDWRKGYGFSFALKVDGVILYETILGSGDPTNEYYANMYFEGTDAFENTRDKPEAGGGISGARLPIVIDAVIPLIAGPHTVEIAVLNIRESMRSSATNYNTYISTREIFVLELLR